MVRTRQRMIITKPFPKIISCDDIRNPSDDNFYHFIFIDGFTSKSVNQFVGGIWTSAVKKEVEKLVAY